MRSREEYIADEMMIERARRMGQTQPTIIDFIRASNDAATAIREAVLAERARCAKIAREIADDPHASNPAYSAASEIAERIEAGE